MIYFCRIEVTFQTSIVRGFDDGDKVRGVSVDRRSGLQWPEGSPWRGPDEERMDA